MSTPFYTGWFRFMWVYLPVITSFLAGSFFWYLIFWNRKMTVFNGIFAGTFSILVSNMLFWFFWFLGVLSYKLISSWPKLEFLDMTSQIIGIVVFPPIAAMGMTFVSFIFGFMIVIPTLIIGGFTGGLIAYVYKKRIIKKDQPT